MADNDKVQFQNVKTQKAKVGKVKPTQPVAPVKKIPADSTNKDNDMSENKKIDIKDNKTSGEAVSNKPEKKKPVKKKVEAPKRDNASIYGRRLPISLKQSKGIGKFIVGKKIEDAIRDLELVIKKKIAVPMTGELAHRKGKGMMSGKYPLNASKEFIKLLKSLNANSIVNGMALERTIISEVIPNKAPDRMHRYGRTKFKQTHVLIKSKQLQEK